MILRLPPAHHLYLLVVLASSHISHSLYEEVEANFNVLRNRHLNKRFWFVDGDGLAFIRLNYPLCDHPELYEDGAPFIISVQGESPHGVYPVLHVDWRLYIRFIGICVEELKTSKEIWYDPPVKAFNTSFYFLWRMTRAASNYLVHLSQTTGGVDQDLPNDFMDDCQSNINLAWLSDYLFTTVISCSTLSSLCVPELATV
eukprot:2957374-Pleurochrysis_carterae.AAC.1